MDLFWLVPILIFVLFLFRRGFSKIKDIDEPMDPPQGRIPPRE